MPCYDPPPPWSERSRRSEMQAVKLLCATVGGSLSGAHMVPEELLEWYVEHRRIDLEIATSERASIYRSARDASPGEIQRDIEAAERALALAVAHRNVKTGGAGG